MKKALIFIIFLFFINLNLVTANSLIEIGNMKYSYNHNIKNNIDKNLKELNDIYGINMDIVFLGQDKNNCYKERNYIKCIKDEEGLMGDFIWTINIGIKERTGKGDVNSFMSKNVQMYRQLFNEQDMKSFQKASLNYLKKQDYINSALNFSNLTLNLLKKECSSSKNNGFNLKINDCKIKTLSEVNKIIKQKEELKRIKENKVAIEKRKVELEQEKLRIAKEKLIYEKQQIEKARKSAEEMKKLKEISIKVAKVFFIITIIGIIIYYIVKYIQKILLYRKTRLLLADLIEYKKFIEINEQLLKNDKEKLLIRLNDLLTNIEKFLGNHNLIYKDYNELIKKKKEIEKSEIQFKFSKNKLKKLNNLINDVKKIDI